MSIRSPRAEIPGNYCPDALNEGGCDKQRCRLRHDIFTCSCGLVLRSRAPEPHLNGRRHRSLTAALAALQVSSTTNAQASVGSSNVFGSIPQINRQATEGSQQNSGRAKIDDPGPSVAQSTTRTWDSQDEDTPQSRGAQRRSRGTWYCEICKRNVPASRAQTHATNNTNHLRLLGLANMENAIRETEQNRNGISVSHKDTGIDFGIVQPRSDLGTSTEQKIELTITRLDEATEGSILVNKIQMTSSMREGGGDPRFFTAFFGPARWIRYGKPLRLMVYFKPSDPGRYEDKLELVFLNIKSNELFAITRRITATVGDREDHEILQPRGPFVHRPYVSQEREPEVNRGERPTVWSKSNWVIRLPMFEIPSLPKASAASNVKYESPAHKIIRLFFPGNLNPDNYVKFFQSLLYLEEEQLTQDLAKYAMEGVEIKSDYPRYQLKVPGLFEGRPSILVGDSILLRRTGEETGPWWEGVVHQVRAESVFLRFGNNFSTYKGVHFDVNFKLNRISIRRMHQAIRITHSSAKASRLIFPSLEHVKARLLRLPELDEIRPFNRLVGSDGEQLEAVGAILKLPPGSPPFIIFGPPGTGKTVTLVESIRQLVHSDPEIRILACAPSNTAADWIAQKLTTLGPSILFRLNALSRSLEDLPKELRRFSLINGNEVFRMPLLEEILSYRVIVSTCVSAGVAYGIGVKRGHFKYVFIDEAGQASEPLAMVPIRTVVDEKTNVILAGDPKQLGPIIHFRLAGNLGLATSYLSRLMDLPTYDLSTMQGITIVKLVKHFRSHPAILAYSNEQFYANELETVGDPAQTHSLENWQELPAAKFPLIFHSIKGKDQREASSPSFFNIDEATLVKQYCIKLVKEARPRVKAEDIGVISPYHGQVCKIKELLGRDRELASIKVGSVEQFQGQERRVIIISTVRSNDNYIFRDVRRSLGFVAHPQRFNVAVTRAQALLIVIGNAQTLSLDPLWRGFLSYTKRNGAWRGTQLDWELPEDVSPEANENFVASLRARGEGVIADTVQRLQALVTTRNQVITGNIPNPDDEPEDEAAFLDRPVFREHE